MNMRALFVEHDDLSLPGLIGDAFARRGYEIVEFCVVPEPTTVHPVTNVEFPAVGNYDLVVTMGAPWSVYHTDVQAWVGRELRLLADADAAGVPVLGVCFGGPL